MAALHAYKVYDTVTEKTYKDGLLKKDNWSTLENAVKDPAKNLSLNVSFGTEKSESSSDSTTVVAQGSNVKAEGDVAITSTEEDINIKGSNVEGENVTLNAAKDLNVTASKDSNVTEQDSESSSASIGVGMDLITGKVESINIGGSKAEGTVDANSTSYNESMVTADKELDFTSGEDTNIVGGKLTGEKVTGNVGGDLNIESKQDSNSYNEENKSAGLNIGISIVPGKDNPNKSGIYGSASESNIDSKYDSVTDQSGIYAGDEGFDIYVEDNTDLKGGIISGDNSEENKLSTGTLTYEDIKNEAEYEAGSHGVAIDTSEDAKRENAGVTPNEGMPVSDEADSTTKATVSEGEIEIRDKENQKQDLSGLNRDTQNALNKLGEIFDKDDIEEKQEFIGLAQEIGHNMIGDLTGKISDEQKAVLNAFLEGLISQWANGDFLSGASGAAVTEAAQEALNNIEDPAVRQIAVGLLSAAITKAAGGDASAGASAGISTEKYNYLTHEELEKMRKAIKRHNYTALVDAEALDKRRNEQWLNDNKNVAPDYITADGDEVYLPVLMGVDISGNDVYLIPGPNGGVLNTGRIMVGSSDIRDKINNYNIGLLQPGEFYTVSKSLSYGIGSISISLSITSTGDIFQEIQILGSYDESVFGNLTKFGGNISEGIGHVSDGNKNITDNNLIRQTLAGSSLVVEGSYMGFSKSISGWVFNKYYSVVEGNGLNTSYKEFGGGFSVSEFIGNRESLGE